MTPSKNILEADSIVVSYDDRIILHNVYIRVEQGEIVGLLGRNGCGKSTMLKAIFGAVAAEHKTVRINGTWMKDGYLKSRITMLPQFDMVPDNVRLRQAMRLLGVDVDLIKDTIPNVVLLLDHSPLQLSGGERRVFELLLVLYSGSQFCFLDEPFTGLSPVMVEKIIAIMQEVKKTKGILITDHLYRQVTSCADRIYSFRDGILRETKDRQLSSLY